ncbi:MAG: hypothetical protein ACOCYP_10905 [Planctomycetota bacterium]
MESTFAIMVGLIGLVWLMIFGLWVWSLIHCITNPRLSDSNRLIGILIIIFLGPLGSLIYLAIPREPARRSGSSVAERHRPGRGRRPGAARRAGAAQFTGAGSRAAGRER